MKNIRQIRDMQTRIERTIEPGAMRGAFIMALEWVVDESISTSEGLETWLDEYRPEEQKGA